MHVAVDALGNPLRVILSAGQIADIEQATALIQDQPAEFVVADKGYDSDAFVTTITEQGISSVLYRIHAIALGPRLDPTSWQTIAARIGS